MLNRSTRAREFTRRLPNAAILAILVAILSSIRNRPLREKVVVFGEVGLAGEIRPVHGGQERLREAARRSTPVHPALNGAAIGVAAGACAWVALDLWCLDPTQNFPTAIMGPTARPPDAVVKVMQTAIKKGTVTSDVYQTQVAIWRATTGAFRDPAGNQAALVPGYAAMLAVGSLLAAVIVVDEARRRGYAQRDTLLVLMLAYLGGLAGAWAVPLGQGLAALARTGRFHVPTGMAAYGGLIGGTVAAIVTLRRLGRRVRPFLDAAAPAVGAGYFFARVGCFLAGCDYGCLGTCYPTYDVCSRACAGDAGCLDGCATSATTCANDCGRDKTRDEEFKIQEAALERALIRVQVAGKEARH